MSADWVIRLGADARLDLDPIGTAPGVTAELVVRPRPLSMPLYATTVRIRQAGLALEVPGSETAKWSFGIGGYEVWLNGPKDSRTLHASGRVLIDRR